MKIENMEQLLKQYDSGKKIKYIFFWGDKNSKDYITKSCLSQWYSSPFETDGVKYLTAEHYMMGQKAKLFNDQKMFEKIIEAENPGKAKAFGRKVKNFDNKIWDQNRFDIVVQGNIYKFSQNIELKKFLLNSGDKVLVEASPVDKIWGVGLGQDNKKIENPNLWKGLNLLGFALMKVRTELRRD